MSRLGPIARDGALYVHTIQHAPAFFSWDFFTEGVHGQLIS